MGIRDFLQILATFLPPPLFPWKSLYIAWWFTSIHISTKQFADHLNSENFRQIAVNQNIESSYSKQDTVHKKCKKNTTVGLLNTTLSDFLLYEMFSDFQMSYWIWTPLSSHQKADRDLKRSKKA